jgi:hypothetical protein
VREQMEKVSPQREALGGIEFNALCVVDSEVGFWVRRCVWGQVGVAGRPSRLPRTEASENGKKIFVCVIKVLTSQTSGPYEPSLANRNWTTKEEDLRCEIALM